MSLVVSDTSPIRALAHLRQVLDLGESEAIVLAQELACPAVLMDEAAGRATARRLGLLPIGTLGILVQAKQRAIVVGVKPLLDQLQTEIDFFVSASLRTEILRLAGES